MIVDDFIKAGYKKFSKSSFKPYAEFGLQKCIRDELGKKYFITVWVYPDQEINGYTHKQSFVPDLQFCREGKITMNVEMILNQDSTIEDIEQEAEAMWKHLGSEHYSRYF